MGTRPSLGKPGRLGEQSLLETRACFKEETESPAEAEGTAQDLPAMGAHAGRCWGAQPPAQIMPLNGQEKSQGLRL